MLGLKKSIQIKPTATDKLLNAKGLKVKFKDDERIEHYMPTPEGIPKQRLGMMTSKRWPSTKTEFRIKWNDGDADIQAKTLADFKLGIQDKINAAGNKDWKFIVVTDKPDFIISFTQNNQAWSYVGTDCGFIAARGMVTMNLGWHIRYRNNQGGERFGTGCHEMLHALGYIHTLQSPACKPYITWNKPAVYAKYARIGWDKTKVDQNILTFHAEDQISDNGCDFKSLMCYSVDPGLANIVVGRNMAFTPLDNARIVMDYASKTEVPTSLGKKCKQSTEYEGGKYPASNAIDGNTATFHHTDRELQPWLEIDMGKIAKINRIQILNRLDCCQTRIKAFKVFVTNAPTLSYLARNPVFTFDNKEGLGLGADIIGLTVSGRYIKIWVDNGTIPNYMHLAQVNVYETTTP